MKLLDFVDPVTGMVVGALPSSVVTFPSGHTIYGPTADRPKRLRKTEHLQEDQSQ